MLKRNGCDLVPLRVSQHTSFTSELFRCLIEYRGRDVAKRTRFWKERSKPTLNLGLLTRSLHNVTFSTFFKVGRATSRSTSVRFLV